MASEYKHLNEEDRALLCQVLALLSDQQKLALYTDDKSDSINSTIAKKISEIAKKHDFCLFDIMSKPENSPHGMVDAFPAVISAAEHLVRSVFKQSDVNEEKKHNIDTTLEVLGSIKQWVRIAEDNAGHTDEKYDKAFHHAGDIQHALGKVQAYISRKKEQSSQTADKTQDPTLFTKLISGWRDNNKKSEVHNRQPIEKPKMVDDLKVKNPVLWEKFRKLSEMLYLTPHDSESEKNPPHQTPPYERGLASTAGDSDIDNDSVDYSALLGLDKVDYSQDITYVEAKTEYDQPQPNHKLNSQIEFFKFVISLSSEQKADVNLGDQITEKRNSFLTTKNMLLRQLLQILGSEPKDSDILDKVKSSIDELQSQLSNFIKKLAQESGEPEKMAAYDHAVLLSNTLQEMQRLNLDSLGVAQECSDNNRGRSI